MIGFSGSAVAISILARVPDGISITAFTVVKESFEPSGTSCHGEIRFPPRVKNKRYSSVPGDPKDSVLIPAIEFGAEAALQR